ncbi:hypothetical protein [Parageobacillus thermoglucosidasius]|uniref:Dinitrogenase iron-molybdenum cofactor biosynthesis domain-containing protein n=2 Tax=Parageobacillus thermoglucosidasius TaxID=1426 RepID=A0AB38R0B5_PARTM|nr:hypothetical protein [Parageobacillus thermoglucosidasius]KYD12646.1 hypothetical protein B4168_3549 [Anoxybacillus flavithermus]REK56311.1 MAG: hypothetical protein C6P36_09255 [Geobacillus sp.]ALF08854.1 hypothetical protein AOT13_01670 [Parageobacillus thermoglucosidasius]ANZ28936.1 hypothetical protein BCV53_01675 [Parageobacillus thermoglucosidasius]APM79675.1 hypothetical protein BCV54_01685 [Parageobacillus thermoglucosidasius]
MRSMIIALVLDHDENIVPIIDGTIVRIYDTESGKYQDYPNPALHLKEGRRGAVLRFAQEKGAAVFASPPKTFCELSYAKAQENHIQFCQLDGPITFDAFQELFNNGKILIKDHLPAQEIVPS